MTIDVIMPLYNGDRFVAEAIESVLAQCQPINSLIIVDDGSTDASALIASRYRSIDLVRYPVNRGQSSALNIGIERSKSDVLAFIDADDVWPEAKVSMQIEYLKQNPHTDGILGAVSQFETPHWRTQKELQGFDSPSMVRHGFILGALMIKRRSFDRVGRFSTQYEVNYLLDWYARARRSDLRIDVIDDVVLHRRSHGNNMTVKHRHKVVSGYLHAIKQKLDHDR